MSKEFSPDIKLICGDPGGANALVPVILQLHSEKKEQIQVFAYRQAADIFLKKNISFSSLDEQTTYSEILDFLKGNRPKIIVTGTSFDPIGLEVKFIHAARILKIPSLSLLDYWCLYSLRFSENEGDLKYVPDKIAIMDEMAYSDMITEGFHPDTLIITGQPAFDALAEFKSSFSNQKWEQIRSYFHIHSYELFIVFVSEPLSIFFGEDESNPQFLGYTEISVINQLITALEQISQDCNKHIALLIRPHPREKTDVYEKITSNNIRIIVSKEGNPRDIVMASDLVIGMTTELLVEACYLGCIVVSLQPELRFKDVLPTNNNGFSIPVYSKEKIYDTLKKALIDPYIRSEMKKKVEQFKHDGHATNRIVNIIYQMMVETDSNGEHYDKIGN
ncbi:MAG: hypothetical protein WC586_01940 [Methanoregula sp.]